MASANPVSLSLGGCPRVHLACHGRGEYIWDQQYSFQYRSVALESRFDASRQQGVAGRGRTVLYGLGDLGEIQAATKEPAAADAIAAHAPGQSIQGDLAEDHGSDN